MKKNEALEELKKIINKDDTVYTVLRHVSKSGIRRHIDIILLRNNQPKRLTHIVAQALEMKVHVQDGLIVDGGGIDMGHYIVHNLSMAMFCPDKYSHAGAYALKHEWI